MNERSDDMAAEAFDKPGGPTEEEAEKIAEQTETEEKQTELPMGSGGDDEDEEDD